MDEEKFIAKLFEVSHLDEIEDFDLVHTGSSDTLLKLSDIPACDLEIDSIWLSFCVENEHIHFFEYCTDYPELEYRKEDGLHIFQLKDDKKMTKITFA